MPQKRVTWTGSDTHGTVLRKVNRIAFKGLNGGGLSKKTLMRYRKQGHFELVGDTDLDVAGQRNMAVSLKERYGHWGHQSDVKNLESAGMPWWSVGSKHGYCTNSVFHWIENQYRPERDRRLAMNFIDCTGGSGNY